MTEGSMAGQGRPFLVWVILILTFVGAAFWVFFTSVVTSGTFPVDEETQAVIDQIRTIDLLAGFIQTLLYVSAAVALFMMRRAALYLFVAALCGEFGMILWMLVDKSRAAVMDSGNGMQSIMSAISVGISLALCMYAFKLTVSERLA
jgi:hypothetical protein